MNLSPVSLTVTVWCPQCGTITHDASTCTEAERIRAEHDRKARP